MGYFDNNACVPMTDAILKQYSIGAKMGNISNNNPIGMAQKSYLTKLIGEIFPGLKVIYNSGASEANSTVLHTYLGDHIICPTSEHSSITEKIKNGNVTWIRPLATGHISVQHIVDAIRPNTRLIILQSINSETGAVQDLNGLVNKIIGKNIHLHCDHVQGFMKLSGIPQFTSYCKRVGQSLTMSISFHKIGSAIGFGALLTNKDIPPLIAGTQNDGFRGGTYNISAMCASIKAMKDYDYSKVTALRDLFDAEIEKHYLVLSYAKFIEMIKSSSRLNSPGYIVVFSCDGCLPHTIFLAFGMDNEILCNTFVKEHLAKKGIIVGSGSACNSEKKSELGSMRSADIPEQLKNGFTRISLSCYNTPTEIRRLVSAMSSLVE